MDREEQEFQRQRRKALAIRFNYHAPFGDQAERYERIRLEALRFAEIVMRLTPSGKDQSEAFDLIHKAMMQANAAIAIGEECQRPCDGKKKDPGTGARKTIDLRRKRSSRASKR